MIKFFSSIKPLTSATAASLALHGAVIVSVILSVAAESKPRLPDAYSGCVTVFLLDDAAVGRRQGKDDGRAPAIGVKTLYAVFPGPESVVAAVETSVSEIASRKEMLVDFTGTASPVAEPVFTHHAGKAGGGAMLQAAAAEGKTEWTDRGSDSLTSAVARYRENPYPIYPKSARMKGYEGLVLVEAEVRAEGLVADVRVKASSGHAVLDRSALTAVRDWKFEPGRKMGIPVAARVDVPVRFVLRE